MERILHIALRTPEEQQPALARALAGVAEVYDEVDWDAYEHPLAALNEACVRARAIRATLVFMQIQRAGVFSASDIAVLRQHCDLSAVIINWDGDQHHEAADAARRWFVELGKACDASLVCNTEHPDEYAAMGVQNPGYLQIGFDETIYRPTEPTKGTPEIVMLASSYPTHSKRNELVYALMGRYGHQFAVYGHGWTGPCARPMLRQTEEAGVYAAAKCAISMSIRADLRCYTSDRLFRALGSGAVVLAEWFPGMDELGIGPGEHCLCWTAPKALFEFIDYALEFGNEFEEMRRKAAELAHAKHTWTARMPELLRIVEMVRAQR